MVEIISRPIFVWCFWLIMAVGNLLWTTFPQLLMLVSKARDWEPGENVTTKIPLSSLLHRPFPEERRLHLKEEVREMFHWGYDNYMKFAFPEDELNPLDCAGRGHDWDNPSNININDVLGDYSLTLVDSLDTLAVMGNKKEFKRAVQLVIKHVNFNKCSTVQVFEASIRSTQRATQCFHGAHHVQIDSTSRREGQKLWFKLLELYQRVIGSLLSAHLIIVDPDQPFGSIAPAGYSNELLLLAHDLAGRLLPAFDNTTTGLPYPRVNLCGGQPNPSYTETCTAGAGTLTVEFGLLSRLLGDPVYENLARQAVRSLWDKRHVKTGLLGNVIDVKSAQWVGRMSGLGAGLDSFYEYLLKSYILFGEDEDLEMFNDIYKSVMRHLRRGPRCRELMKGLSVTTPPHYVNVDYSTGSVSNHWIDSLSASFAGLQVLTGDVDEAICSHALHYSIWRRYGALPERFDWSTRATTVAFYPLRPELVESTYLLYQATKNPFYLHVGSDIFASLEKYTKARCGYATVHDVNSMTLEDRMESFFLSETCKYLYLLFDSENIVNQQASHFMFTTEGHVIKLKSSLRQRVWLESSHDNAYCNGPEYERPDRAVARLNYTNQCPWFSTSRKHNLPLSREHLGLFESLAGLH